MKSKKAADRFRLGVFVAGAAVLITALIFYIGANQQLFGSKKEVIAIFKNVSGLKTGNLVRYSGVTIGTVDEIIISSDSTVTVVMKVDAEAARFIKKDSEAHINSEGVLGSKYISITSGSADAESIKGGAHIAGKEPLDFDKMLNTLNKTGENANSITQHLEDITQKINEGEGTLGSLISDRGLLDQMENMVSSFQEAGEKTNELASKMEGVVKNAYRTTDNMAAITDTLKAAGYNAVTASENMMEFTNKLNNDSSTLGKFISDTSMAEQVDETLVKMTEAAEDIQITSCRVRNHWFMRLFGKK